MVAIKKNQPSYKYYILLTLKGFCMGASDVIPGVSGGTIAFILGIYEDLIQSIKSIDLNFLKTLLTFKFNDLFRNPSLRFLVALGLGILSAILSLARVLSWLIQTHPVLIWSFFFGLVLASVFAVGHHLKTWNLAMVLSLFCGASGAYLLVGIVPLSTPDAPWFLFLCGAVAICAMILPGISGSFILVLLGKYFYILEAVNQRNLVTLFLVTVGAGFGLISFVRILNWLFKHFHDLTIAVLTGLMLGALRKVWPWKETVKSITDSQGHTIPISQVNILPAHWDVQVTWAVCLMALGFFIVVILSRLARDKS
jgi:putative membrane protein